jgi:site-specific recombinase XerD
MNPPILLPNGKIDIHDFTRKIITHERRLLTDSRITEHNKQLVLQFIRDCELGKTVQRSQKKKLGKARLVKYLDSLRQLAIWIQVDFDQMDQSRMEDLVLGIENDRFTKKDGHPFSESVKRDFKVCLRKFYKWLLGNNETYPAIVQWIDTRDVVPEIPCLVREEIERMSEYAASPMERAIIWVLFDSGARVEEFLNVRFRHLEETLTEDGQTVYRARIEFSKTKPRTVLLPIASRYLRSYLAHQSACLPERQVFPLSYQNVRKILNRVGKNALGKRVHPHLMRHSSATYYAPLLSRAAFCNRYGWSYGSNMADRYIDREALTDQETVRAVTARTSDQVSRENTKLRENLASMTEKLSQLNALMTVLSADPAVSRMLAQKIRQLGQGERLNELRLQKRQPASVGGDAVASELFST